MSVVPPARWFVTQSARGASLRSAFLMGAARFVRKVRMTVGACLERRCGSGEGVRQIGKAFAALATGFSPAWTNGSARQGSPFPSRTKASPRRKRAFQGGDNLLRAGQSFLQPGQRSVRAGHSSVQGGPGPLHGGAAFVRAGVTLLRAGQGSFRRTEKAASREKDRFSLLIRLLDTDRFRKGSENSPALQCWVKGCKIGQSPARDGRMLLPSLAGLCFPWAAIPSAEALGYFQRNPQSVRPVSSNRISRRFSD